MLDCAVRKAILLALLLAPVPVIAADLPKKEGDFVARDFKFHNGEVMPELRLHYVTLGDPKGEPVLVLHGTSGSSDGMLGADYAGALFGPGQPLDTAKYYIIVPDSIGHGKSSKPSDGLRAKFPHYDLGDMVEAQYRLLTEGLGVTHLRLVTGNSMGGMESWLWGEKYPSAMDALAPMASLPGAMAARNWMLRRMMIESIVSDPAYAGGNYTEQPRSMRIANVFYGIASSGGTLAYQKLTPTSDAADKLVDDRLAAPPPPDANDFVWQWSSSHDYDPAPALERIEASVLAINSADDERNPPETGVMESGIKRLKDGHLYLIPASSNTRGHGTTAMATFYAEALRDFLAKAPHRGM